MRFRLFLATLMTFLFVTLASGKTYGLIPIKQDKSELQIEEVPTQDAVMTSSIEDIKRKKKEILEAEKVKPKKKEEDYIEKRKPYVLPETIERSYSGEEEKVEPTEVPQLFPEKSILNKILVLLIIFLISCLFYKYILTRQSANKDSQKLKK